MLASFGQKTLLLQNLRRQATLESFLGLAVGFVWVCFFSRSHPVLILKILLLRISNQFGFVWVRFGFIFGIFC